MGIVPGHDWWRWLLAQGAPRRASLLETCAVPAQEPPNLHANSALVLCLVASAASASRACAALALQSVYRSWHRTASHACVCTGLCVCTLLKGDACVCSCTCAHALAVIDADARL